MKITRALVSVLTCVALCGAPSSLIGMASAQENAATSSSKKLALGDAAPALPPVTWRLGEPIKQWEAGTVYVLDFWATWCKPCIAAMPHMIDLQREYESKNVRVLGLAIWPNPNQKPTDEFVTTWKTKDGKSLNYAIADDIDGKVSEAFMESMNRNGIPTVMIIDQKGRLAWVGHPMSGMDEALSAIVAGTYNIDAEIASFKKAAEIEEKSQALMMEFQTAQMAGDWNKVIEASDKLIALDKEQFAQAGIYKYMLTLTKVGDKTKAAAIGRELASGIFAEQAPLLNTLAFLIVDSPEIKDEDRDIELAFEAVNKANEIEKGERPEVLDTLAKVYFSKKDFAKAIETQEKAISLVTENPEMKQDFESSLAKYKEAAGAQ